MVIPGELAKRCCRQAVNAALTLAFSTFGQVIDGLENAGDDETLALVPGGVVAPGTGIERPQVIRIPAGGSALGGLFLVLAAAELESIIRGIGRLAFKNSLVGTSNAVESAVRRTIENQAEHFDCSKCIRTYALRQFPNRRTQIHTTTGQTIQKRA